MDTLTEARVTIRRLNVTDYASARLSQEECVARRLRGEIGDVVFTLQHPETITLGRRSTPEDFAAARQMHSESQIAVVEADRGGRATYHGPGQLIIYPVIMLPERGWGVRKFVELGLEAVAQEVRELGIECQVRLNPAGVWSNGKKVASVGVRIVRGVTNHGFSLNVTSSLAPYGKFSACGLPPEAVTTLAAESGGRITFDAAESAISRAYFELLR